MRAVTRIFSILDAFTSDSRKLTLQEISDRVGLSKATTFRFVNSLRDAGLLVRLEDQRYCVSLKMVRLGGVVVSGLGVREVARPVMEEIGKASGETVSLNTVIGLDRVCIDVVNAESRLTHIVDFGEHAPLFHGGTGRVLLAHLPGEERSAAIDVLLDGFDMSRPELEAELAQIRERHYVIVRSKRVEGALAISGAIFDEKNRGAYALTLTGPEERVRQSEQRNLDLVLRAQREISAGMGSTVFTGAG